MEKIYETDELVIIWRPEKCQHAAKCVKGAPDVFNPDRHPWIDPKNRTTEEIISVISQCPSGALTYRRK
ncbi:MAG: (4Fe-4S)-binding protein [Eubacterium sp.]|jgi:uncharacterized Fe-S cluster protein YjdI